MKRLAYVLVPLALAFVLQIAGFHDLRHDDAFITFRYGQNVALGHGLVFNPGERLMGSTSPGEALLSALVYALAGLHATPSVMAAIGCAAWTAQGVAIYLLLAPALGTALAAAVGACVLAGVAGSYNWVALETNLAVALTLFALASAQSKRWSTAALLCGIAAVVRPDTLLVTALLGLRALLQARRAGARMLLRPALAFLVPTSAWLAFAYAYFGDVVPRSLRAKLQRSGAFEYASHMLQRTAYSVLGDSGVIAQLALVTLVALGAVLLVRASRSLGWLVAYGLLHFVAYAVLRTVIGHDWHFYPAVVVASVLALAGVLRWGQSLAQRVTGVPSFERSVVIGFGAVLAITYGLRTLEAAQSHPTERWNGSRDAVYRQLGRIILPRTTPGEYFSAVEVGTLAYYTQLPAFDIGMLVSNRKQRPPGHIRWVVLDDAFLGLAPPWPPLGNAHAKDFRAFLYEVPAGASYFDILHERLAASRKAHATPSQPAN